VQITDLYFVQDKLARLNAAITEGLKLQRVQEAQAEEEAEAVQEKEAAVLQEAVHVDESGLSHRPEPIVEETKSLLPTVEEEVKTIIDELIKNGGSGGGGVKKLPINGDLDSTAMVDNAGDLSALATPRITEPPTTTIVTTATTTVPTTESDVAQPERTTAAKTVTDADIDGAKDSAVLVGTTDTSATANRPSAPLATDHPSSHFRPPPAAAAANWTTAVEEEEFFPMPKSNLMPKDSSLGIMITNGGGLPQKPLPKR
jgi:hypothetical protein